MIDFFLWMASKHVKGPRNYVLIQNFSSKKIFVSYKKGPKIHFDFSRENYNSKPKVEQLSLSYEVITNCCILCFNSAL